MLLFGREKKLTQVTEKPARKPKTTLIPVALPGTENLKVADEEQETKAALALLDEKEKHQQDKDNASAAGGNADDLEKVLASLSERKMLGLSEYYSVGTLSLPLRAVSIRDLSKFYEVINFWPLLVTYAALTEEPKKGSKWATLGFDPSLVAELQTRNLRAQAEFLQDAESTLSEAQGRTPDAYPEPDDVSPEAAVQQFRLLASEVGNYAGAITKTTWLLLDTTEPVKIHMGKTGLGVPGGKGGKESAITVKTFEEWENLLLSHLSVPLLVPLLRAVLSASGGFPGDIADRFATP